MNQKLNSNISDIWGQKGIANFGNALNFLWDLKLETTDVEQMLKGYNKKSEHSVSLKGS